MQREQRKAKLLRIAWAVSLLAHAGGILLILVLCPPPPPQHPVAESLEALLIVSVPTEEFNRPVRLDLLSAAESLIPSEPGTPSIKRNEIPENLTPDESTTPGVNANNLAAGPTQPLVVLRSIPQPLSPRMQSLVQELSRRPAPAAPVTDLIHLAQLTDGSATSAELPTESSRVKDRSAGIHPASFSTASDKVPTIKSPVQIAEYHQVAPIHGPLPENTTVVYVLDGSGSMGLYGRWQRAREALLATRAVQPASVRSWVIVYHDRAQLLDAERWSEELQRITPTGESRHDVGVRQALKLNPQAIILLTDADRDELQPLEPILRGARRPVALTVVRISPDQVSKPMPWSSVAPSQP